VAPQNLGVSVNISAMAEAGDFKFGMQLAFVKAHYKISPRMQWAQRWARGASKFGGAVAT